MVLARNSGRFRHDGERFSGIHPIGKETAVDILRRKLYCLNVSRAKRKGRMKNFFRKNDAHCRGNSSGFSLLELVVVIAIVAILAALILPALSRAKERGRRAVCLSNLSQIAKVATMYALDNDDRYMPVLGNTVQIALGPLEDRTAISVGLMGKIWTCPNRAEFPIYEPAEDDWLIGYQYFGGLTNWNTPRGILPSASPIRLASAKPQWALAADATMKVNGSWGGGRDVAFADLPPHPGTGPRPAGGNQVHVDGSARWVPFENMYFIQVQNWRNSACESFFFQDDLGDYGKREPIKAVNAK